MHYIYFSSTAAAAAKSLQSCLTLCDPIDGSPPGSSVPGILQARILEWVAISFSNEWKWKVKVKSLSHARLSATPWTAARQAPLSMGFSRQEYWSGVPLPSPEVVFSVELILLHYCETLSTLLFIPWIVCVFLIWLMGTGSVFFNHLMSHSLALGIWLICIWVLWGALCRSLCVQGFFCALSSLP